MHYDTCINIELFIASDSKIQPETKATVFISLFYFEISTVIRCCKAL